ncbi:hypothetical protein AURDEDRAFT_178737 [Auricularia subglabra TFB-10046 SS5]|uniref:Uncharacterized protein n=1 Tax=Auricularia subglabra (strain TFB-10046 / SS5) TaxID=717982 RepID=J0WIW3_AURST|nr:hypothetical protein AURDEDRAFT_178737 [Auricularia subglabra TFB-10046 SS5]
MNLFLRVCHVLEGVDAVWSRGSVPALLRRKVLAKIRYKTESVFRSQYGRDLARWWKK